MRDACPDHLILFDFIGTVSLSNCTRVKDQKSKKKKDKAVLVTGHGGP
jgi:hypothetical protein